MLQSIQQLWQREAPVYGKTSVTSESDWQVAHRWVGVDSFHARLFGVVYVTCDDQTNEGVCIKCCANLGKIAAETLTMIQQGFRDQSLSRTQVIQWHIRFKTGRT